MHIRHNSVYTPWGYSDSIRSIAPGIALITTPSHGGIRLSDAKESIRQALFPDFKPFAGAHWYEEDCDQHVVVLTWPEYFCPQTIADAVNAVLCDSNYWDSVRPWILASAEGQRLGALAEAQNAMTSVLWEVRSVSYAPTTLSCTVCLYRRSDGAERTCTIPDQWPTQRFYRDDELPA